VSAVVHADFDVVDDEAQFFAPCSSDMVDGLLGQYQAARKRVESVAAYMQDSDTQAAVHYFLDGNRTEERGRMSLASSAAQLFQLDGAVAALNAAYWSKALALTDVLDTMPQKRRDEWNQSIREHKAPEFEEATVRATLTDLLNSRAKFFAERVDGIFRGLSGTHVTNAPEAFGKRMIIAYVTNEYGSADHSRSGLINDLRCVIAKFMGRDEPKYYQSSALVTHARRTPGEWVDVDGGALRLRCYKIGTAHLEVHPDMAWRLNQVLASLYPLAIPAQFRQKPKRKAKDVPLMQRPLPFAVVEILAGMKQARERCEPAWPERYRNVTNTLTIDYSDRNKHALAEAEQVLRSLGGVKHEKYSWWWEFEYNAEDVIADVVHSGCIPDQKAHQFYPTPAKLAERVVAMASEGATPGMNWLEPSAGQGGLADYMPKDDTACFEVSALNCKVLAAKGHSVTQGDFLAFAPDFKPYNRIVMNPPFDQGRWRAHLEHAAGMVAPAGRLVAILPSGAKGTELPGFKCKWHGPYSNEFPGTSVDVVILVADRA